MRYLQRCFSLTTVFECVSLMDRGYRWDLARHVKICVPRQTCLFWFPKKTRYYFSVVYPSYFLLLFFLKWIPVWHCSALCSTIFRKKRVCMGYVSPSSGWGKQLTQNRDEHLSVTGYWGGNRAAIVATPQRENGFSHICLLYTHWMQPPITHLANRKESQTGFDLWPKTAPIPDYAVINDPPASQGVFAPQKEEEQDQLEIIRVT